MKITRTAALILSLVMGWGAVGQEGTVPARGESDRPRTGLVLSGGGARGCAHVGVLKVLEELRVPVDAIAGTSFGALVGALYSAGFDPQELEEGFAELDWDAIFSDRLSYRDLSLRRKADVRRYVDFDLGFQGGRFILPAALLAGQRLDFKVRTLVTPVAGIEDFDRLPIPFRAVATDLSTGDVVVLSSGDLATAVRASLSIPGVLAPVELGEKILVDGGLVANLPVNVVRQMGVDRVLAVDVGNPLLDPEELDTLLGVMSQTFSLVGWREAQEQASRADVLIRPDMPGVGSGDFDRCVELMAAGEAAARSAASELAAWSVSPAEWETRPRGPQDSPGLESLTVVGLHIEGLEKEDARRVRRRIRTVIGEPLDLDRLEEDLSRVSELGTFEEVRVTWKRSGGGVEVTFELREQSWGRNTLRSGMYATDDLEGNNHTDFRLAFTRSLLNSLGGEWKLELQTGRTRSVFTEVYQPLDFSGRWFAVPSALESRTLNDVYQEDRRIAEYSVTSRTLGADVGVLLGRTGEVRLGLRRGRIDAEVAVGAADLPDVEADVGGVEATFLLDRLDSPWIPRQGTSARIRVYTSRPSLGADDGYEKLSGEFSLYGSRYRHGLFFQAAAGASPGSELPAYDEFTLGGILSLSGFGENQLRGQSFVVGRFGYTYRLMELPSAFGKALYLALWAEAGNVGQGQRPRDVSSLITTGTVALAAETRIGPVYLALGHASGGFTRFYAALGQRF